MYNVKTKKNKDCTTAAFKIVLELTFIGYRYSLWAFTSTGAGYKRTL